MFTTNVVAECVCDPGADLFVFTEELHRIGEVNSMDYSCIYARSEMLRK